jgi:nucleotide-binding universal stress UspA family protein
MERSIVVGIDGSTEATEAARVAASLARDLDRRLVLAHVVADPTRYPYGDRAGRETRRRQLIDAGDDLVQETSLEIGEESTTTRVVLGRIGHGYVEDRLAMLSREEHADLLVVGSRRRNPILRTLLGGPAGGSTALLASMSECPVLVVPRSAGARFEEHHGSGGSIICGVDGSTGSDAALEVATNLATRLGVGVLPVTADVSEEGRGDDGVLHIPDPNPARTLAEVASWNLSPLIAVGMRASEARRRSVSRRLVATAPVPVLIVPPGARPPRFSPARPAEMALAA